MLFASICIGMLFTAMASKAITGGLLSHVANTMKGMKEVQDLSKDLGWSKKKDSDEMTKEQESDLKDLRGLLKKKPEDLTNAEKRRIQTLQNDSNLDLDDVLSDKEKQALENVTGKSAKSDNKKDEEQKPEERKLMRNKCLASLQSFMNSKNDDNSDEARQMREDYDSLMTCMFSENGDELDEEEINKNIDKLPKDMQERIQKQVVTAASNTDTINQFKEQTSNITDEDAAAAVENAKATRLEITKRQKLEQLEQEQKKELKGIADESKIKEIEDKYKSLKDATTTEYDAKINDFKSKAADMTKSKDDKPLVKAAEQKKADLETRQHELEKDEDNTALLKKYKDFKFTDNITAGDLDSEDEDKKKAAEDQLKAAGLDIEMFRKVESAKASKKEDGSEKNEQDLATELNDDLTKDKKRQLDDIKKDIDTQNKVINKDNTTKETTNQTNDVKQDDETNDDETEDETNSSTLDDTDMEDEADDEESKKKQDPRKVWKQKNYKRGNKTYKTKSYYNKKGDSISADDFKQRVQNYEEYKKSGGTKQPEKEPQTPEKEVKVKKKGTDYKLNKGRTKEEKGAWDAVAKAENKHDQLMSKRSELQDKYANEKNEKKKEKLKAQLDKIKGDISTEMEETKNLRRSAIEISRDLDSSPRESIEYSLSYYISTVVEQCDSNSSKTELKRFLTEALKLA